jgi:cytidine deaminase
LELFLGLIGPAGTNLETVLSVLTSLFHNIQYETKEFKISRILGEFPEAKKINSSMEFERINGFMNLGNSIRKESKMDDILARLSIYKIRTYRNNILNDLKKPLERTVYIINSLKHPSELKFLRDVYKSSFYAISVYTSREKRLYHLSQKMSLSEFSQPYDRMNVKAEELIQRDESEKERNPHGQNIRDTYPEADVFIDATTDQTLKQSLKRFIEIIFGNTFHIPTNDEFGMFNAYSAALRSSSLARQVGAAITNQNGDILSTGMNDIPLSNIDIQNNNYDERSYTSSYDTSDEKKLLVLGDLLRKLNELELLKQCYKDNEFADLIKKIKPDLKNSQIMNIIEYNREIHAEMSAILSLTRNGMSTNDCKLFTTTFPCHNCAKHIIEAGIEQVIYIEPYPKSLTADMYSDYIQIGSECNNKDKVYFKSFIGISPRKYIELFRMMQRKDDDGKIISWNRTHPKLRYSEIPEFYISREANEVIEAVDFLKKKLAE